MSDPTTYEELASTIAAKYRADMTQAPPLIEVCLEPTKYQPKEGDVIERGRDRWVLRWHAKLCGGEMYVTGYRQGWWDKVWREVARTNYMPTELAAMVNHMGWRVLP